MEIMTKLSLGSGFANLVEMLEEGTVPFWCFGSFWLMCKYIGVDPQALNIFILEETGFYGKEIVELYANY
jgi:hypothetical protein